MENKAIRTSPEIKGVPLKPIHEKCVGCDKIITFDGFNDSYCRVYASPCIIWRIGCGVATHINRNNQDTAGGTKRIGQQKSKKKSRRR